jgi:hypothetical protein
MREFERIIMDNRYEEMEAEYFAAYDSVREANSSLDPYHESMCDDEDAMAELLGGRRPNINLRVVETINETPSDDVPF